MYFKTVMLLTTCLFSAFVLTLGVSRDDDASLLVETSLGRLRGINKQTSTGKTVRVFYKVPFAEPPVGELRFKPPEPVKPWPGVLDCTKMGAPCMQKQMPLIKLLPALNNLLGLGPQDPSEDCLFLNIFVPQIVKKKLPVMVFVHGGGFVFGGANSGIYDATTLVAEENVIVVILNYRLTFFGFLYLGIDGAPGNMGLMDQGSALRFVYDHISSFGGDPQLITFFGQSAGAISVAHHLHVESSIPLIRRVILQSGTAHMPHGFETKENLMKYAKELADNIGCPFNDSNPAVTLKCFMNEDAKDLIDNEPTHGFGYNLFFQPVFDGKYMKKHPLIALGETSKLKKFDIMLGHVEHESTLFLLAVFPFIYAYKDDVKPSMNDLREIVQEMYGLKANSLIIDASLALYNDVHEPDEGKRNRDSVIRMGTDSGFLCPSFQLENALLKANRTVYKYRFKHAPKLDGLHVPDWIGALHSSELLSLFGHPIKSGGNNVSDDVVMLSRTVMRYWANFARTGNPSISPNNDLNLSTWAPMSKDRGNYQILDINSTATGYFDGMRCKFWNHLFPKLYRNENQNTPSEGPFLKLTDEEEIT